MIINLENPINNISLQIGDRLFYAEVDTLAGTTQSHSSDYIAVSGFVTAINSDSIEVSGDTNIPDGAFLMFCKSNVVNNTSLKGYYASVTLANRDTRRAELFAVGSEVIESSK